MLFINIWQIIICIYFYDLIYTFSLYFLIKFHFLYINPTTAKWNVSSTTVKCFSAQSSSCLKHLFFCEMRLITYAISMQTKYAVNQLQLKSNLSVFFVGRRRCWPSRKTKSYHRFPDPYHTCVAGTWWEGWTGYRGVPSSYPHPWGLCHPPQESKLWILNHHC